MEYFEVPEANLGADGLCSDNDCPCGYPGATIPRGTGYIYVSQAVIDFRRDALTVREAQRKIESMRQRMNAFIMFDPSVTTAILMCELGAKKRGLDLEVAAADARHWWKTGLVPLRATPLAGSTGSQKERARMEEMTFTVEEDSLEEARDEIKHQLPEGYKLLSEKILSDGKPETIKGSGDTTEAAFSEVLSHRPPNSQILEKKEISPSQEMILNVVVKAFDEHDAQSSAEQSVTKQRKHKITTKAVKLTAGGAKGFLGIGRKPNQYEVELIDHIPATVEVIFRTKVRISATAKKS